MNAKAAHALAVLHGGPSPAASVPPVATARHFDGGARAGPRLPRDPVADHDALLAKLLVPRRISGDGRGWRS